MIPYLYCPFCCSSLTTRRIPDLDPMTGSEGPERRVCSVCGFIQWGNSKPTASAIVVREDGCLLLARRGIEPRKGMWDIPGGFLEAGEHPEAGAVREIREETGLSVAIVRFIGVYIDTYASAQAQKVYGADTVFTEDTLNFYYECRVLSGVVRAEDDVEQLTWFAVADMPTQFAFRNVEMALADYRALL